MKDETFFPFSYYHHTKKDVESVSDSYLILSYLPCVKTSLSANTIDLNHLTMNWIKDHLDWLVGVFDFNHASWRITK